MQAENNHQYNNWVTHLMAVLLSNAAAGFFVFLTLLTFFAALLIPVALCLVYGHIWAPFKLTDLQLMKYSLLNWIPVTLYCLWLAVIDIMHDDLKGIEDHIWPMGFFLIIYICHLPVLLWVNLAQNPTMETK